MQRFICSGSHKKFCESWTQNPASVKTMWLHMYINIQSTSEFLFCKSFCLLDNLHSSAINN